MSETPEQKEKHKLARERLRRLRALAKLRRLQERAKARAAKAALAASSAPATKAAVNRRCAPAAGISKPRDARRDGQRDEQRQIEINALERDIAELSRLTDPTDATAGEINRIRHEVDELKRDFYAHLASWQRVQLARHPQRPYTDDFIRLLFENFSEIHGDRNFADDPALITGMASFQRPAGYDRRQPERPRHEAAPGAQFRPGEAGRLPQSAARHAARGEIPPADLCLRGYAGRVSRHRRRRTRPGRSDRAQYPRNVPPAGADHRRRLRAKAVRAARWRLPSATAS